MPILKPALLSSFTLIFVVSLREYSTAIYLFTPGNEVLGVSLLFNWLNGDVGIVAVLSIVQIVLTMVFIYAARLLLGIRIYQA